MQNSSPLQVQGTLRCVFSPRWICSGAEHLGKEVLDDGIGGTFDGVSATRKNHKTTHTKLLALVINCDRINKGALRKFYPVT